MKTSYADHVCNRMQTVCRPCMQPYADCMQTVCRPCMQPYADCMQTVCNHILSIFSILSNSHFLLGNFADVKGQHLCYFLWVKAYQYWVVEFPLLNLFKSLCYTSYRKVYSNYVINRMQTVCKPCM